MHQKRKNLFQRKQENTLENDNYLKNKKKSRTKSKAKNIKKSQLTKQTENTNNYKKINNMKVTPSEQSKNSTLTKFYEPKKQGMEILKILLIYIKHIFMALNII